MNEKYSARDVAVFMLEQLNEQNYLYQEVIVWDIRSKFGERFVYENQNGNLAISRDVLKEFRNLTKESVVWERGSRLWRKRESYDPIGKRQAD